MAEKTCLIIGKTGDFENKAVAEIAKKGGEPEYLDSCDLQEEYGRNVSELMTDNDLLSIFKDEDGSLYAGNAVDQKLEFLRKYVVEADASDMSKRFGEKPIGFLKSYFASIALLHENYDVPYFEMEKSIYKGLLSYPLLRGDFQLFEDMFMWGCRDDDLPDEFWNLSLLQTMGYAFALRSTKRSALPAINLVNRCVAEASPRRKMMLDELGVTQKLNELNAKIVMKLNSEIEGKGNPNSLKIGGKLDIPALKKAIKGNRVTILFGWATWCSACRMAVPSINDTIKNVGKGRKGVKVVGIVSDAEDPAAVAKIRGERDALWKKDIRMSDEDMMRLPGGIPYFILVDDKGVIRDIIVGADQNLNLEENLKKAGLLDSRSNGKPSNK